MKLRIHLKQRPHFSRHRLSGKLILLFVVMAVVFVVLVGYGFKRAIHYHFETNVRSHIVKYLEYVAKDLGIPPDPQRARQLADELGIEINIISPKQQWSSHHRTINIRDMKIKHSHFANGKRYDLAEIDDREYLATMSGDVTLLFTVPNVQPAKSDARGITPIVILLLILLVLYHATRRLFSPIQTIEEGVKRIGQGDLDHRITVNRRDELGELANSINTMADDIQRMLDAKRQLLLAISHELRSPLTRAKIASELLADEQQKRSINEDLNEMEKLIEEILETERLSSQHSVLNKSMQDLPALIKEVVDKYFPDTNVTLDLAGNTAPLNVDSARLSLLVKNLIDNAITHTLEDSPPPAVTLREENKTTLVEVKDYGRGIDKKHLPHLTEPFYRVDPSRQRETGGYGLGLYLCKMIAEAHGGSLVVSSELGTGTVVIVSLPRQ